MAAVATAGATVPLLRRVSVLGVRTGDGPQGLPINRTAVAAGVSEEATGSSWRLTVLRGDRAQDLTLDDLRALPQQTVELPIACVEGWSATGAWTGPTITAVLGHVGAPTGTDLRVTSLEPHGAYRSMRMPAAYAADPLTLVALRLGGEPLHLEHGYPARVIAPGRPGVPQTKWLSRIEVLA